VEPTEIMEALLELAQELELDVRILRGTGGEDSEFSPTSTFYRVQGRASVMLSPRDPIAFQVQVLASALAEHAGAQLDGRYLPPAIRSLLDADDGGE
jgi:hypothetical protein